MIEGIEGTSAAGFEEVAALLAAQLAGERAGGAALCVTYRGEVVVDVWGGVRDPAGTPWARDTVALSFSTTKGVMSTLVHRLADRGLLDYDAPLAALWPEFAGQGKDRLTLRHVLGHRAGLHAVRGLIGDASEMLDWDRMTSALAAATPQLDPRGRSAYHALTYGWLVGEVVRRATRGTLREALARELCEPLGLDGAWLGCPPGERHRLAELILPGPPPRGIRAWPGKVVPLGIRAAWALLGIDAAQSAGALLPRGMAGVLASPELLDADVPAMNGVFTARALARVYTVLACEGSLDGVRYLSPETVEKAGKVQGRGLDAVLGIPMAWRLGYHFIGTSRGVLPRAFGHFGYGGSGAFADPRRRLAVAMTVSRVSGTPVGDRRMLRIAAAAAAAADRRARK
jgi:CubicO group peptidase (beta-lactamase class C family)